MVKEISNYPPVFFNPTLCLFMALASVHSHALLVRTLKFPSIRFYVESGVTLPAVIPTSFTYLPIFTVYSTSFTVVPTPCFMLLHVVPPYLFEPFSVTLPSPASHFVVTTTCSVIIISSNILLRTILVL